MPDPIGWVVLFVGALVGSVVGGVAGFGAGIIMLPLVSWAVGIRSAVPVLTVTMSIGNLSRIWWSRGEVDRAVVVRFALGAVPATALGTALYAGVPAEWLGRFVGVFLIASVPIRRLLATDLFRLRLPHFPLLGAALGLLSLLVAMGLRALFLPRKTRARWTYSGARRRRSPPRSAPIGRRMPWVIAAFTSSPRRSSSACSKTPRERSSSRTCRRGRDPSVPWSR